MDKQPDRTGNQRVETVARPELTLKRRRLEERLERKKIARAIDDFESFFEETLH